MQNVRLQLWTYRKYKNGQCPIKLTYNKNGRYFKENTGFQCTKPHWDFRTETILGASKRENDELHKLKADLEQLVRDYRLQYHENPEPEYIRENWKTAKNEYFRDYIQSFIEAKRPIVSKEAIKDYISFKNAYHEFEAKEKKRFKADSFTNAILERFHSFVLNSRGLNNNTAFNRLKTLKSILNYYSFPVPNYKVKRYNPENITLNDHELNLIKEHKPQSGRHQRVKDLFLLGCSTGLRFGDILKLKPEHFVEENNKLYLRLFTNKTKDSVSVPLNSIAKEIVKKYDFQIPKISNQRFNQYVKELLKQIPHFRENMESKTVIRGNSQETDQRAKYLFVGTHTMRRSFITNALEKGIPPATVASLTGLTISTMYSYVNQNQNKEEHEQKLEI